MAQHARLEHPRTLTLITPAFRSFARRLTARVHPVEKENTVI